MRKYNNTVINQFDSLTTGNSAAGATVTVRDSDTQVKATLFSDDGITETVNPAIADDLGNYGFFIADGVYDLVINENETSTYTVFSEQIKEVNGTTSVKEKLTIVADQTTYTLNFSSGPESDLIVDGRVMTSGATVSGNILTLDDPLFTTQEAWVYHNGLVTANEDSSQGSRGNPFIFDDTATLVSNNASLVIGNWTETLGNLTKYDGESATYLVVDNDSVGEQDGYQIVDLNGKKGFGLYFGGIHSTSNGDNTVSDFPYDFKFPTNDTEQAEMLNIVADNSIGYGGSTWWLNAPMGRTENNVPVIYRGSTYGSSENRDLAQGSMDSVLWTNKRLGEAVKKVTRLVYDSTITDPIGFSLVGINDKLISFREDEHQQPSVMFNNKNGQLILTSGSRNDARTQDGGDASNLGYIRYGQDSNTLSVSETQTYDANADYAQGFFVGSTAYWFKRVDIGQWEFVRGSGGQNYLDPIQFFDPSTDQYYFNIAIVDKTQDSTVDPQSSTDRTKVHFFGQAHPTNSPDRILRYAVGTFILAGQESSPFNGGGLYVTQIDGSTQLGSNTSGRLDDTFVPFVKADMNTAYTAPVGSSYRLLDVQYGDIPSALIAEFVLNWTHGDTVPYQKTYDLKQVRWNGATWDTLTIASGLRGMLGYEPQANGTSGLGVEGYTSAYVYGACYQRSNNHSDLLPVIYYCDRAGNAKDTYRLNKVTLNAGYTAVSADAILKTSDKILYRPESTLYGDKRVLWYNSAEGWSSFNSWVAQDKFLNE